MVKNYVPALKLMSEALKRFWVFFGGKRNSGSGFDQDAKLKMLQEYSRLKFTFKRSESKSSLRAKFELYKEAKRNPRHSLGSHPTCFVCQQVASQRHHIVALKNGGKNWKKNLVSLCKSCHDKVEGRAP